jgi:hypothetical protein
MSTGYVEEKVHLIVQEVAGVVEARGRDGSDWPTSDNTANAAYEASRVRKLQKRSRKIGFSLK